MNLFFIMFFLVFGFVALMFVFVIFKLITSSVKQNAAPRITTRAKLIDKRNHVFSDRSHYYGTFEFPSGDRSELRLPRDKAGTIVVGDEGELTFQGTVLISFEREVY